MIHNDMALAARGLKVTSLISLSNVLVYIFIHITIQVGMLDLLIKSHWYKCSVSLEGAHLGITLDDDIDIITSQGDTDITIPSDVPPGVTCDISVIILIELNSRELQEGERFWSASLGSQGAWGYPSRGAWRTRCPS